MNYHTGQMYEESRVCDQAAAAAGLHLDRFPDPLPMGSGTGVQCLPKRGIFLFGLAQHKIGFGW